MSISAADPIIPRPTPNPWRWSPAANICWQVVWAAGLAVAALCAAALILPGGGHRAISLALVTFHELGHALAAVLGDGHVHRVAVGMSEGHVLHTSQSQSHAAMVTLAGPLAPAALAGFLLVPAATRRGLEFWLVAIAACLAGTAQFAVLDAASTQLYLYVFAAVTLILACLPKCDLAKAAACWMWAIILMIGLWLYSPGLYDEPSLSRPDHPPLLSDTQKLTVVFDVTVTDMATFLVVAQIALVLFPAAWVANWLNRYTD